MYWIHLDISSIGVMMSDMTQVGMRIMINEREKLEKFYIAHNWF